MGPLLFLVAIFFLNFLSRIILSPLMPAVEKDLGIGHDEAGSLFLLISLGYCAGLVGSGFVSSRLKHKKTIFLSSMVVGGALTIVSISHSLWGIRFGLILCGMAAGLYLPSGIATVTELVRPEHWGKAIAIHELAPNLSFVTAPFLAEALLIWCSWRGVLTILGMGSVIAGIVFASFGKGGTLSSQPPDLRIVRSVLAERSIWIMIALFTLAVGASFGVYAMLPLYLVSDRGMERAWANTLVGLSRILTPALSFLAGWVTDHLGVKQTLKGVFLAMSLTTVMLGIAPGSWIILIIFLQSLFAISFFPPGFTALSRVGSAKIKDVAVSVTMPFSILGIGVIPAGIGFLGQMGFFPLAFVVVGGLCFGGVILVRYLKFGDDPR
jgi:NNP family nitrate/nitrite transporter-like MFS transporter